MGNATRESLAGLREAVRSRAAQSDPAAGEQILAAGRAIAGSSALLGALTDSVASTEQKAALVQRVFGGSLGAAALQALVAVVAERWSEADDLLIGIEELGIRTAAASAPAGTDVAGELFAVRRAVASNGELELALSSSRGTPEAKVALVDALAGDAASEQSLAILRHLARQPRGRRAAELLRTAVELVADQSGHGVAVVQSAAPLTDEQRARVASTLQNRYGLPMLIDSVVEPGLLGGLRIQVGSDVIDSTIARRLGELRLQLAG